MPEPLTCREFIEFLDAYCDDTLAAARRAEFEEHLGECRACRAYLEEYRATVRLARSLGQPMGDRGNLNHAPEQVIEAARKAMGRG